MLHQNDVRHHHSSISGAAMATLEKVAPYPQAEKGMKRQVIQLFSRMKRTSKWNC
jgi:serine protease inhibitor ecotin